MATITVWANAAANLTGAPDTNDNLNSGFQSSCNSPAEPYAADLYLKTLGESNNDYEVRIAALESGSGSGGGSTETVVAGPSGAVTVSEAPAGTFTVDISTRDLCDLLTADATCMRDTIAAIVNDATGLQTLTAALVGNTSFVQNLAAAIGANTTATSSIWGGIVGTHITDDGNDIGIDFNNNGNTTS